MLALTRYLLYFSQKDRYMHYHSCFLGWICSSIHTVHNQRPSVYNEQPSEMPSQLMTFLILQYRTIIILQCSHLTFLFFILSLLPFKPVAPRSPSTCRVCRKRHEDLNLINAQREGVPAHVLHQIMVQGTFIGSEACACVRVW